MRMRTFTVVLAAALAATPVLAHQNDAVSRAERAGRWLQLEQTQVDQLAVFITQTQLQRRDRARAIRPEILAVLDQAQKARMAELMLTGELKLPRRGNPEARLARLEQALGLSSAQVDQLRSRSERLRAQNQALKEQRKRELVAIVGSENALKIGQRVEQRRSWRDRQP